MKKIFAAISACILTAITVFPNVTFAADTQNTSIAGDVNADGLFSADDVVMMQKWLTGSDEKLSDKQAADVYQDGNLNVMDLCQMKRMLTSLPTENTLDKLKDMSYEDAVKNNYILKSEYNYQISGNLKSTIEDKMGRPLDYSKDRFYLVKNKSLGLSDDAKYIYNSDTKDTYSVTEETRMNCATWYWKGSKAALYGIDDDIQKQNEFLDAMEFYGITEIYYSIGANKLVNSKDMVETFVKNAYARNIKVYMLTGDKTWLYEDTYQTAIYRVFDRVKEYNSMVDYDARIAGVSYDVEVWTNSDFNWKNNEDSRHQQVKFIETAQNYVLSAILDSKI